MRPWTEQEIIDYFDSTNVTLRDLSELSGVSVPALKQLLMENDNA